MKPAQTDTAPTQGHAANRVLSVDAMGGDKGPATVVAGLSKFLSAEPHARAILHGPKAELDPLVAKHGITGRVAIHDAADVVKMTDKPSHVLRNGKTTSMWSAIEAVRSHEAAVAISCGNTGALMAMSMLRLRKAEGVNRPAIACLWPSRNPAGFNV
ncbi:MAG: phosphate acyltransferase, partial [Paracoccaceae bacterium]|nr:phosphate acyltransferase [Paracoccaceae bacterium]